MDRERFAGGDRIRATYSKDFVNPYPQIPGTDARVMLELQHRHIPFAYRWFNDDNPFIKQLLPGWAPEFTLKDLKVVILVYGTFFGQIPGVLQEDVLATVILQQAGWTVLTWWEYDIESRLNQLFDQEPKLANPAAHGGMYTSPYGIPDLMSAFRELRQRQRRYISSNARTVTRTRRRPNNRGGAFVTNRRKRDLGSERKTFRRSPGPSRYPRR